MAADIAPCLDAPPAARVDDTERGDVEPAAFVGSGSEADASGDHGVAQGTFGLVVGRRKVRVPDEGDDRVPVVEDFAGSSRTFFSKSSRLHWQFHLMRTINRLTAREAAQVAD